MIHEKPEGQQDKASADWKIALNQGFKDWQTLARFLELNPNSYRVPVIENFPMRIPYSFALRMKKGDINDPLLKQVLADKFELDRADNYVSDPLSEREFNPVKGALRKYHNRILLMLHPACAVHCRYCFRREYDYQAQTQSKESWSHVFNYIREHAELDEVIFSGGDPLLHNDERLSWFVAQTESIPHIKRLRIHTRIPIVLPKRVTKEFLAVFNKTHLQKIMVVHANHGNEIAADVIGAFKQLKEAGFSILNQATLLKGVNDNAEVLKALSERLFEAGVLPYYLHVLDKVKGVQHFDVDEEKAKAIHHELKAITSGYLVPKLVREIAHQKSKTWLK
ncbi:EF-P beta-lysylation protein EpmB [Caedibacter taeniospiralis]|uniref:EF-P beta-lysylation protein EpmB n=1 Tax=Caedibacter taeniospiralis TaxID=28907 RepID=UPI000C26E8B5|nr:EF-P beta-lysylation protein EpmB [Caedibacter taeniospiralis]